MIQAAKRRVSKDFFYRELGQVKASAKRITEDGLGAFYLNNQDKTFRHVIVY